MLNIVLSVEGEPKTFRLSKKWIQSTLSDSVLASALELDPQAKELQLETAEVTPSVLRLMVELSQGHEPDEHAPELTRAHRYLKLDTLMVYASPLYPKVKCLLSTEYPNLAHVSPIKEDMYKADAIAVLQYLVSNDYTPTVDDLRLALVHQGRHCIRALLKTMVLGFEFPRGLIWKTAIETKQVDIVTWLLEDGRFLLDFYAKEVLRMAVQGSPDVLRLLLQQIVPDVKLVDDTLTLEQLPPVDIFEVLIEDKRVEVEHRHVVYLINIYTGGSNASEPTILGLLLQRVDPTAEEMEGLYLACYKGCLELVKVFMDHPALAPAPGDILCFERACMSGNVDLVRYLLAHPKVDTTQKNDALLYSIDHRRMTQLLIKNREVRLCEGARVFHRLLRQGDWESAEMLLERTSEGILCSDGVDDFIVVVAGYWGGYSPKMQAWVLANPLLKEQLAERLVL